MCITLGKANLTGTTLMVWQDPAEPEYTYLMYSNIPDNEDDKPNAMVLPLPFSKHEIGPEHIVPLPDGIKRVLPDLFSWAKDSQYGGSRSMLNPLNHQSFKAGAYQFETLRIEDLRERGYPEHAEGYRYVYGDDVPLLACEFDNEDPVEAHDILIRYNSKGMLFLPLLDSHDGTFPDVNSDFPEGYHQQVLLEYDDPQANQMEGFFRAYPKYSALRDIFPKFIDCVTPDILNRFVKSRIGSVKQRDIFFQPAQKRLDIFRPMHI